MRHTPFISRTVLVRDGNVDSAFRLLNRILGSEGLLEQWRRCRFYEKPTQVRRRVNFEKCKALYNEDMSRKVQFLLRKNRVDAFPGCQ
ncbi:small ribosomal subunit protein bS21m [Diachasmimorpha longicaudata]|uniref:small ribosomal subunit protein bS21m n=1 Tax=Diachasmimorpha longicaudata TaxID=58733 RepID=UPI0030B8C620